MGISVVLQDEEHNNINEFVHDREGAIAKSLPVFDDTTYACARFIDPYGNTIFNYRQAGILLVEWDRLSSAFSRQNAQEIWAAVREMIVRCAREPHVFLKFTGD